jgi:hypothetical protein
MSDELREAISTYQETPMGELVWREQKRCIHGLDRVHHPMDGIEDPTQDGCEGGYRLERVLDDDMVLGIEGLTYQNRDERGNLTGGFYYATLTVADVKAALEEPA